jgi:hypothetical protein
VCWHLVLPGPARIEEDDGGDPLRGICRVRIRIRFCVCVPEAMLRTLDEQALDHAGEPDDAPSRLSEVILQLGYPAQQ